MSDDRDAWDDDHPREDGWVPPNRWDGPSAVWQRFVDPTEALAMEWFDVSDEELVSSLADALEDLRVTTAKLDAGRRSAEVYAERGRLLALHRGLAELHGARVDQRVGTREASFEERQARLAAVRELSATIGRPPPPRGPRAAPDVDEEGVF